jgi:hypothetical protein
MTLAASLVIVISCSSSSADSGGAFSRRTPSKSRSKVAQNGSFWRGFCATSRCLNHTKEKEHTVIPYDFMASALAWRCTIRTWHKRSCVPSPGEEPFGVPQLRHKSIPRSRRTLIRPIDENRRQSCAQLTHSTYIIHRLMDLAGTSMRFVRESRSDLPVLK